MNVGRAVGRMAACDGHAVCMYREESFLMSVACAQQRRVAQHAKRRSAHGEEHLGCPWGRMEMAEREGEQEGAMWRGGGTVRRQGTKRSASWVLAAALWCVWLHRIGHLRLTMQLLRVRQRHSCGSISAANWSWWQLWQPRIRPSCSESTLTRLRMDDTALCVEALTVNTQRLVCPTEC